MSPTRPTGLLALLGATLLVHAGCGGEDRLAAGEYRARLAAVERKQERSYAQVEKALKASRVADLKQGLETFAADQERMGQQVEDLKAPADAERANARLGEGLQRLASDVRAAAGDLASVKNPKLALKKVDARMNESAGSRAVDDALTQLKQKGYTKSG